MKTENILATRAHKVIYRDGDTAVKVFDANFPKTDVLNEALNQARVDGPVHTLQLFVFLILEETELAVIFCGNVAGADADQTHRGQIPEIPQ